MKKWLYCGLLLAGVPVLSFGGFGGEDVGRLSPVQVVALQTKDDYVQVLTDAGGVGIGDDISDAIGNLRQTAQVKVFLDTADYLLVTPETECYLPELRQYLRPSCCLCYVMDQVDLKMAGEYLQTHEPKLTMTHYEAGERQIPYLISEEERLKLVQQ